MKRIVVALSVAVVLAVLSVTAWNTLDNASVATATGTPRTVPHTEVEKLAKDDFARPWEDAPSSVSCPRGLRPEKFDHVRCDSVFKGAHKPMLIAVTKVDGDRVSVDYGVLEKGKPGGPK